MLPYDAYIVHASENVDVANEVAQAMRARGLTVWCNSFEVGHSIRRQMEEGLINSSFGVVLVTRELFAKKWAMEELDVLIGQDLVQGGRLLPVWIGVSADEVMVHSPMLASRYALIHREVGDTALTLVSTILRRTEHSSPAQWLRANIATGLRWDTEPVFLPASLTYYDEHADAFFLPPLARYPEPPPPELISEPRTLLDLLRSARVYDGVPVTTIAKQDPASRQVLGEHFTLDDSESGEPASAVSYLFQLRSVEFTPRQLAYVHCVGLRRQSFHGTTDGPWPQDDDDLCWINGLVLAHGAVHMSDGGFGQCVYMAARAIYFSPPVEEGPHGVRS